ncbi:MAG: lysylphosphatidylglycerol synthase transmembrane domain-containing protein [Acidimicrobiales bacterium]
MLRYVVGLGLVALAGYVLAGRRGELAGAGHYLDRIDWWWILLGVLAEAGSFAAFAAMQVRLLRAGRVEVPIGPMSGITLAATAITNSLPAGPAVATVYSFRQYRRRGADDALAGWVLVAVFVAASASLALVALVGVGIAGAEGANLDLVGVIVGVTLLAIGMGVVFVQQRVLGWLVCAAVRASRRIAGWPKGELGQYVDRIVARLTMVSLTGRDVGMVFGFGVANWALDCTCLALAYLAVEAPVPWKGLLLAYGAGQLAANLPITPGGLGVVEGSLTIALVAYGGVEVSTVAAVLLYRLVSFWAELPVGWVAWGWINWHRVAERSPAMAPGGERPAGAAGAGMPAEAMAPVDRGTGSW